MTSIQGEVTNCRNTQEKNTNAEHSVKSFIRDNSAFMEVCNYLNIPTAPERRGLKPENNTGNKKKKKKKLKYFKDIEILNEKFFIISKYYSISNSSVNTVISDMNNIESSNEYIILIKITIEKILLIIVITLIVKIIV